jgi:hypothetical protein
LFISGREISPNPQKRGVLTKKGSTSPLFTWIFEDFYLTIPPRPLQGPLFFSAFNEKSLDFHDINLSGILAILN